VLCPKKLKRIPHPVYSPDLSQCDLWFFGYAKEQMKDQTITSDDDLEGALTDNWESVSRTILQLVFREWMARLGWVIEHHGKYYINPH
jgi:NAD dependent epimerase/dehydratase family enzyme